MELIRCTGESRSASGRRKYHLAFSPGKIWATHAPVVYIIPALSNFISILSHYTSKLRLHCSNAFHDDRRNSGLDAKKQKLSLTRPADRATDFWEWHFLHPESFVIYPKPRKQDIHFNRDVFFSHFRILLPCTIYWCHLTHHWRAAQGNRVSNTQVNFLPFCFDHKGWNSDECRRVAPKELFQH